jgi:hypothetical protein
MNAILPLVGVALGWGLKALSDYFISIGAEAKTFRKATFYILKVYKALLDYDRGTTPTSEGNARLSTSMNLGALFCGHGFLRSLKRTQTRPLPLSIY